MATSIANGRWENLDSRWLSDRAAAGLSPEQIAARAGVPVDDIRDELLLRDIETNGGPPDDLSDLELSEREQAAEHAWLNGRQWTDSQLDRLRKLLALGDSAAWRTGDTVLELVPMGRRGQNSGAAARVAELAGLVGVEPVTLKRARKVAHAWPPATRIADLSMTVHAVHVKGGPRKALERASWLRDLRDRHGRLSADDVRTELGQKRCRPKVDSLRNVCDRIVRLEQAFAKATEEPPVFDRRLTPGVLRLRAETLRSMADRLEALSR
jgi:hypothetical protein